MGIQHASAEWKGTLKEGEGRMRLPKGNFEGPFTFASRFEDGTITNPEELAGAALSGCFSMFLSALLTGQEFTPTSIQTDAEVTLDKVDGKPCVTQIQLKTKADVPGLENEQFQSLVQETKANCPISKLYAGTSISVEAVLAVPQS